MRAQGTQRCWPSVPALEAGAGQRAPEGREPTEERHPEQPPALLLVPRSPAAPRHDDVFLGRYHRPAWALPVPLCWGFAQGLGCSLPLSLPSSAACQGNRPSSGDAAGRAQHRGGRGRGGAGQGSLPPHCGLVPAQEQRPSPAPVLLLPPGQLAMGSSPLAQSPSSVGWPRAAQNRPSLPWCPLRARGQSFGQQHQCLPAPRSCSQLLSSPAPGQTRPSCWEPGQCRPLGDYRLPASCRQRGAAVPWIREQGAERIERDEGRTQGKGAYGEGEDNAGSLFLGEAACRRKVLCHLRSWCSRLSPLVRSPWGLAAFPAKALILPRDLTSWSSFGSKLLAGVSACSSAGVARLRGAGAGLGAAPGCLSPRELKAQLPGTRWWCGAVLGALIPIPRRASSIVQRTGHPR